MRPGLGLHSFARAHLHTGLSGWKGERERKEGRMKVFTGDELLEQIELVEEASHHLPIEWNEFFWCKFDYTVGLVSFFALRYVRKCFIESWSWHQQ